MKTRECVYCKFIFDCSGKGEGDYCLRFIPQDEDAEKRYKEWRSQEGCRSTE